MPVHPPTHTHTHPHTQRLIHILCPSLPPSLLTQLIAKYDKREVEQRKLLQTMTHERDGLRQRVVAQINEDANRSRQSEYALRRQLEVADDILTETNV